MAILIGLGNPGPKFQNTRHNVGFMAVDKFAEKNNFPDFKLNKKFNFEISEGVINEQKILLAKPQTFMNNSGSAVKKIIKNLGIEKLIDLIPQNYSERSQAVLNCKLKIENCIIVIHDDIDLPVGKIKIIKERGSAGHKGVESIIKAIGNKNLIRIRIGISPENKPKAEKVVLKKFSGGEKKIIEETIEKTTESIIFLLDQGLEKAMNEYNK